MKMVWRINAAIHDCANIVHGAKLTKSKDQDGRIIQEGIRGIDTCPVDPGMPHLDELSPTIH